MEHLSKKAAYLKGFAEGLDISPKSEEGRLLMKVIEIIEDMTDEIGKIKEANIDLADRVDLIDDDLGEIEADFYDYDDEEDDDYEDDDEDFDLEDDYNDMDYFEIECPNCKEDVLIDYDMIDEEKGIVCPNCNQEMELEFDCDCGDCDDDCDCHDHK